MAVKDVWGLINGVTKVTFKRRQETVWTVEIPDNMDDGVYIAEIWASDYAGNIAYRLARLYVYDAKFTCIEWIEDKYSCHYIRNATCIKGDDRMIRYLLGETRPLEFEVKYTENKDFTISSATYELLRNNEVVESGELEINGHKLSYYFTPQERGFYLFEVTYKVGGSTRMARYHINVD